jgi:hypothetical protein
MNLSTIYLVLASNAAIDLHLRTSYCDGTWTPEQLLDYLVREQFGLATLLEKPSPQQPHELVAHHCVAMDNPLEKRKNYG